MNDFFNAIEFIFSERESPAGGTQVGGLGEIWELTWPHLKLAGASLAIACAIAIRWACGSVTRGAAASLPSTRRTWDAPCPAWR